MKINKRHTYARKIQAEFGTALIEHQDTFELSERDWLRLLANDMIAVINGDDKALNIEVYRDKLTDIEWLQEVVSNMQTTLKYLLRHERHGDYETPAGIEKS